MLNDRRYPLRPVPTPVLPVADLLLGKPVEEAAAFLPRLFNLCRVAQGIAARAAFGLPLDAGWQEALRTEILREHVVKLCLKWPGLVSRPSVALPRGWQGDRGALRAALFGASGALPRDMDGLAAWLSGGGGASPALRAVCELFAPGEATRPALPLAQPNALFEAAPRENSAAGRHATHPLMQGIEAQWGRGPLWSAMGVAVDLEAVLNGAALQLSQATGWASVSAARGRYGVRATILDGRVAAFERVTPTDHLLAKGGALQHALATLPLAKATALAPLLLSVMDPCFPVSLSDAKEPTNA